MKKLIILLTALLASNVCFANEDDKIIVIQNEETSAIQSEETTAISNDDKKEVDYRKNIKADNEEDEDKDVFETLRKKKRTFGPNWGPNVFFSVGIGPKFGIDKREQIHLGTSLGWQFNHYIYAGIGAGYHGLFKEDVFEKIVLFFNTRFTLNTRVSPFVDFKVGYKAFYTQMPYFSPSAGIRFGITKDMGMSLCVSYENIKTKDYWDEQFYSKYCYYPTFWERGLFFKVEISM